MAPALLSELAELCARLARTPGRLDKRRLVAEYLRGLPPEDVGPAVSYLTGRAFPASDPRVLGVRGLPGPGAPRPGARPLAIADVTGRSPRWPAASGPGSKKAREERLRALASRASELERDVLSRIIWGEMRTGVSEGLVLEAIAEAAGAAVDAVRRAALFLGDLSRGGGDRALGAGVDGARRAPTPRLFVPLSPMLAESAPGLRRRPSRPTAGAPRSSTSTTARGSSSTATATAWRSGAAGSPT